MTKKKTEANDQPEVDEYEAPRYERIAPKKDPLFKRIFNGFTKPYSDPGQRSTYIVIGTVAFLAIGISYIFGGGVKDNAEGSLRYEKMQKAKEFGPSEVGGISEEERARVIADNEKKRELARDNNESFTPHRIGLVDNREGSKSLETASEVDPCAKAIQDGQENQLPYDQISKNAIDAVTKESIEKQLPKQDVLKATQDCAKLVAEKLNLSNEEAIQLAAKAALFAAQSLGLTKEEQIELAASAAQQAAAALGLSKEEQIAAAAKAAQESAAALGFTKEEQIAFAAKAAQQAASSLGFTKEEQIAFAAKAASTAAADLGFSKEEQIAFAAKAAQQTAAVLGLSKEEQIAMAARAAQVAAADLGFDKEEQIAFAAKAAQETAAKLGFSEAEQIAFAARAAQAAAANLGLTEDEQIAFAAKAARESASGFGYSTEKQIEVAAKAAQDAAAALGMSEQMQIDAAKNAAYTAAKALEAKDEDVIRSTALAAANAAKKLGWKSETQAKVAAKAGMDAAAQLGRNRNLQVLAAADSAQMVAASEMLTPNQQIILAKEAATLAATGLDISPEELEPLVDMAIRAAIKKEDDHDAKNLMSAYNNLLKAPKYSKQMINSLITRMDEEKQEKGTKQNDDGSMYRRVATVMEKPVVDKDESATPTATDPQDGNTGEVKPGSVQPFAKPDIAAGEWLYAVMTTRTNTDNARPEVVGVIVGGPFDGANIIGTWERNGEWGETIGLVFNRMNLNGKEIENVELIGFNPDTRMPGFATEVDHHWLSRFVGLSMKALSVGGIAAIEAKRRTTQNTNSSGDLVGTTVEPLDSEEARNLFISHSFGVLGDYGQKYTVRPITIDTYNESMQLLVMNNLYLSKSE